MPHYVKACCPQQAIGEYTPDAWHDLLGDLELTDCREAVAAVAKRQPFVAPAEIRAEVKHIRADRLARTPLPAPPAALADDPGKYQEAIQRGIQRIADGKNLHRAIAGAPLPGEPPPVWRRTKEAGWPGRSPTSRTLAKWRPSRPRKRAGCAPKTRKRHEPRPTRPRLSSPTSPRSCAPTWDRATLEGAVAQARSYGWSWGRVFIETARLLVDESSSPRPDSGSKEPARAALGPVPALPGMGPSTVERVPAAAVGLSATTTVTPGPRPAVRPGLGYGWSVGQGVHRDRAPAGGRVVVAERPDSGSKEPARAALGPVPALPGMGAGMPRAVITDMKGGGSMNAALAARVAQVERERDDQAARARFPRPAGSGPAGPHRRPPV